MSQIDARILTRLDALEAQQATLRRSARRWRAGCVGALVAAGAGVLLAAGRQPEVAEVLRAEAIEIVGADDNVLVALGSDDFGGLVRVFNADGASVAGMEVSQYGGFVRVESASGESVGAIDVTDAGRVCIDLWSLGDLRMRMAIDTNECGALVAKNDEAQTSVLIGSGDSGPGMVLTYRDDTVFAGITSDPDGRIPLLFVANRDGNNAVEVRANRRGEGEIFVSNRDGEGVLYGHEGR